MFSLKLINNSIIFCDHKNKINILRTLSEESLFFDIKFLDYKNVIGHINKKYYFFIKEKYNISYDLSKEIKNYLPFISIKKEYNSKRLNDLKNIKKDLLEENIYSDLILDKFSKIYTVNKMCVPSFIKREAYDLELTALSKKTIKLNICNNQKEQAYSVYETVLELLEKGINIEDIIILNASERDQLTIQKLFRDSDIPYITDQKIQVTKFPKISPLFDILENEGLKPGLDYLNNELSPVLQDKLLSIYNQYLDKDITKNMDIFISILKNTYIDKTEFSDSITFSSIDNYIYDNHKYYLLMNYADSSLIKYINTFSYLTNEELDEIGYYSLKEINNYLEKDIINQLETIENLILFHSKKDKFENILPILSINRKINKFNYRYVVKETSYLKTLNALEYAKASYDFNTFYIKRNDYRLLYNTYNQTQNRYLHQFTRIKKEDLNYLLKQNNTLTASKIESYNLCQFQYLLKYLLKLDKFETNPYQFLGKLTHKVLEKVTIDKNTDIDNIVLNHFDFPEEEIYKEKIYREALLKELKKIVPILIDFHNETKFNIIETEVEFKIPYKEFFITGIIDKAMIYKKENNYFILIDYKLNEKDLKILEIKKKRLLQLPLYLYAYTSINKGYIPAGLYYQKTSIGRYKYKEDAIKSSFKLNGISLNNKNIIQELDRDLNYIKSISYKNNGDFSKNNRLIDQNEFLDIKQDVINYIEEMIKNIKQGKFNINPLPEYKKKTDSISCEYCKFESICYSKNKGGDFF